MYLFEMYAKQLTENKKNNMDKIKDNAIMQQVLKDSFGGIMYNVSNKGKYDATELIKEWDNLSDSEKESYDGIIKGAMLFLTGK